MTQAVVKELKDGSWRTIHAGVVVAETTTHVKVFHPNPEMGDATRESAQWYPRDAKLIKTTLSQVKE